jgi:cholesterol transport system auxiliary component
MSRRFFTLPPYAIKLIAACARIHWARGLFGTFFGAVALAGCSALPDKPTRPSMYDFGPGALTAQAATSPASRPTQLPPLAIDEITTSGGAIDNLAVLYRLGYTDVQQLRPYAQARWSKPAAQLVQQRLREQLGQRRSVFRIGEGAAMNRSQNTVLPLQLRLELLEFSQLFSAPEASVGLVRLSATLLERTPAGEKLLGQRLVVVQRPAPSADAPGGVRALTAATDAAIEEIEQWLQQTQTQTTLPPTAARAP